jgi:NAD(P)-dependent dehydrogenase (short-subunit alcohol dehydrogenase family)
MSAVVLVTGASSGIGLATAVAFARRGDRVFASVRDGRGREAVQEAATTGGLKIDVVTLDVTDTDSIEAAVAAIVAATGRIDVLVNNAGIAHVGAIETTPDEVWRSLLDVNLLGPVRMLRAVLPGMREAGSGTIVNVSSVNGRAPAAFGAVYSATKFALEAVSEALVFEVEPFGIRVVVVEPGQFDTAVFPKMQAATTVDPSSPYADREAKLLAASLPGKDGAADPAGAADVIVAAATGERPGFRHPAGVDAESILGARARASDDEWLQIVRDFLDAQ